MLFKSCLRKEKIPLPTSVFSDFDSTKTFLINFWRMWSVFVFTLLTLSGFLLGVWWCTRRSHKPRGKKAIKRQNKVIARAKYKLNHDSRCDLNSKPESQEVTKFRDKLLAKNISESVVSEILASLDSKSFAGFVEACAQNLSSISRESLRDLIQQSTSKPFVIAVIGTNGVGKTTTLAKLAYMLQSQGFRPGLVASDTFRAGAIEQIQVHGTKLSMPIYKKEYGKDSASVAYEAKQKARKDAVDVLLVDSAGRMPTNANLMKELTKFVRVVYPDFIVYICEAQTGNSAFENICDFQQAVKDAYSTAKINAVLITKGDVIEALGTLVSVGYKTQIPILGVGNGQYYQDLREVNIQEELKAL